MDISLSSVDQQSALDKLSKAINTKNAKLLTPYDIYQIYSMGYNPRLMLYTISALIIKDNNNKPLLSPDMLLIQCINGVRQPDDCNLVGLAVRYGANTNMYINDPKYGSSQVHLLVYAYTRLRENKVNSAVINRCIGLLIASGALTTSTSFGQQSLQHDTNQSVGDWFRIQDYYDWEQIQGAGAGVSENFIHDLAIYLDDDTRIVNKPLFMDLVRAHDGHILNKWIDKYTIEDLLQGYIICIEHYNVQAFGYVLVKTPSPSYVLMNDMIIRMKSAAQADDLIIGAQLRDMIKLSISHGALLDEYQLNEIKSVSSVMAEDIIKAYAEPIWEKDCRNLYHSNNIQLRELAFNLGLNLYDDKQKMCKALKLLAGTPKEKVVAAAVKRKREMVSIRLSDTSTVLSNGNNIPSASISNEKLGPVSPLEYNDFETMVYTDKSGDVWLLTADYYDKIIETKLNPFTGQPLPDNIIQNITNYQSRLRYYNIKPRPISQAVNDLTKPMTINNEHTDREVDDFKKLLVLNQINVHEFGYYTPTDIEKLLIDLKLPVPVVQLIQNHAIATGTIVINHYLRLHPEQGLNVLGVIKYSVQQHYMKRMSQTTSVIPTLGQMAPDSTRRVSVPFKAQEAKVVYLTSPR